MAICERSGLEFVARSSRQTTHPAIRSWIDRASRDGWYRDCLATLEQGKQSGISTIEEFVALLGQAEQTWRDLRNAEIAQRNETERQIKEAKRQRHITNDLLRGRGYRWHRHENDEEDQDFFNAPAVEYTLWSPDGRVVSVQEAMLELAWQGVKFAKEWLAEHNIAEEMPAIEKQRQASKEKQAIEAQRAEEREQYQREAEQALLKAGIDPALAKEQAAFWSQPHSPLDDQVAVAFPYVRPDGRVLVPSMNSGFRYGVMVNGEWWGIDEVLEMPNLPDLFVEKLQELARRNNDA